MWRRLGHCDYCYSLSGDIGSNEFHFSVTNFVNVWSAEFDRAGFVQQLIQCNQHLENVDGEDLLRKVVECLHCGELAPADCSFEAEPAGGGASAAPLLRVTSRTHGYPLRVHVRMALGSALRFSEAVTRPLLHTVADLSESERELSTMLCNKDREIGEYKEEGGQLFLKYLKTAPFDLTRHCAAHAAQREAFGDVDATAALLDVAMRAAAAAVPKIVKPEVKEEINSQVADGSGGEGGTGAEVKSEVKRESTEKQQRPTPKKKKFLNL